MPFHVKTVGRSRGRDPHILNPPFFLRCFRVRTSRIHPPAGDRLSSRPAQARRPSVVALPARGARPFPFPPPGKGRAWFNQEPHSTGSTRVGTKRGLREPAFSLYSLGPRACNMAPVAIATALNRAASRADPPKLTTCNMAPKAIATAVHFLHVLSGTCRQHPSTPPRRASERAPQSAARPPSRGRRTPARGT